MEKMCCTCRITKPLTDFGKKRSTPDQLQKYCRECGRAADRKWYAQNTTKKCAARRAYYVASKKRGVDHDGEQATKQQLAHA